MREMINEMTVTAGQLMDLATVKNPLGKITLRVLKDFDLVTEVEAAGLDFFKADATDEEALQHQSQFAEHLINKGLAEPTSVN